jgi:hypothetical protein
MIEVFQPKFDVIQSKPIVTWVQKGQVYVAFDMLAQYSRWQNSHLDKDAPSAAFWDSNGPAHVRALMNHKAHALIFWYESDRKVCYKWFAPKPDIRPSSVDSNWWVICDVHSEGGRPGQDTRVTVQLPTDEDVHYNFRNDTMSPWLKKPNLPEVVTP